MGGPIKIALVGVGNCAAALLQGLEYYRHNPEDTLGLMHKELCGYLPSDIRVVAAFDIDARKAEKALEVDSMQNPTASCRFGKNSPIME